MQLNIKLKNKADRRNRNAIILAGDVGATKTNLALFATKGNDIVSMNEKQFVSKEYKNITEIIDIFLEGVPVPDSMCFGVAGPVMKGDAKLSNISWNIDSSQLASHFKIKKVKLLNDLEANAYGLAMLEEKDLVPIHSVKNIEMGNIAIIAPGTGLGEAGIFWDGESYHPFATEGGHCDFAPRDEFDFELYNFLKQQFGHVSWERLLCGPGLLNIYTFLRDKKKRKEPAWLMKKMNEGDAAATISQHIDASAICKETMEYFIRYLAYESANIVLKFKATGGLYIGGGIAPKNIPLFGSNNFYDFFCQSGRLNYLLEQVPINIISNTQTALLGAAWYGAHN